MCAEVVLLDAPHPNVARITLNRPDEQNAWTYELEAGLFAALDTTMADPSIRVVVLTGAGDGFCRAASVKLLEKRTDGRMKPPLRRRKLTELTTLPKPIIAAINGPAAGIGLALALCCDVRFAAESASLTTLFARLGLAAEHSMAWLLTRTVGRGRAADLLLSGRVVDGRTAAAIGLVEFVVPDAQLMEDALSYAHDLATTGSPRSWAMMKRQLDAATASTLAGASTLASELTEQALGHPDARAGVMAYLMGGSASFTAMPDPSVPA